MFTPTHLSGAPLALQQPPGAHTAARPATARPAGAVGVGGHSIADLMARHGMSVPMPLGVIVEHLDAQIGTWQVSIDEGASWQTVRTNLINRPGNRGLALEPTARLRVLPLPGGTRQAARVVLHAAQRALGDGNGCYQNYPPDDRGDGAQSITLVLDLDAINGRPPATRTARPRNKRAMAAQGRAADVHDFPTPKNSSSAFQQSA